VKSLCYLNGQILPLTEASIHPLDRGFVFGDAIYEMVKILDGKPLFLEEHLRRLKQSLDAVRIPQPRGLEEAVKELLDAVGPGDGSLYFQVSRGVAPRSHLPPEDLSPTVFMLPQPHEYRTLPGPGLPGRTAPDWRWRRSDIKCTSLMGTVLGKLRAADAQAHEVIFVGEGGEILEGGSTNVLVRQGDQWKTHPLDNRVLSGVTLSELLGLAGKLDMPVALEAPYLSERDEWQEMIICGTLTGVRGIVALDDELVASGSVGSWTRRLAQAFQEYERRHRESLGP
jgi:D-alanine transaminase